MAIAELHYTEKFDLIAEGTLEKIFQPPTGGKRRIVFLSLLAPEGHGGTAQVKVGNIKENVAVIDVGLSGAVHRNALSFNCPQDTPWTVKFEAHGPKGSKRLVSLTITEIK